MNFKKSFISFLLIFSYTLGFAHDFIPHYHVEDIHFGIGTNDAKLISSANDASWSQIIHRDHIDNGVYDYLVCAFSESNHSKHDDKNDILQNSINSLLEYGDLKFTEIQFVYSVKTSSSQLDMKVSTKPFTDKSHPLCKKTSRRGPPLFS